MQNIEPIKLTYSGITLVMDFTHFVGIIPGHDDSSLSLESHIGIHELCRGFVHCIFISKTHKALHCKNCGFRIEMPKEINTYGKLRQWCADRMILEDLGGLEIRS